MQQQTFAPDSPRQIEAQLDHDRRALSASLAALSDRLSIDSLFTASTSLVRQNAGPYAQALDLAVRANPVALALTSVGLAWLILGRNKADTPDAPPLAGTKFEAVSRWEDDGGPVTEAVDPDESWIADADRLRDRAAAMIAQINAAARDRLAPADDLAQSRTDVLAALTKDVRRVMGRGLGAMTDVARDKAVAARELAYITRVNAARISADTVRTHPVLSGVIMAAAGAALGSLLRQTATENRLLGKPRDILVREAKQVLAQERNRVAVAGQSLAGALRTDIDRVQSRIVHTFADAIAPAQSQTGPGV